MLPFCTSPAEVELAVRLGIPLFGSHPDLAWLGTKQGSRRVFLEEDVPHPQGFDAADRRELERALRVSARAGARAVAKLNDGRQRARQRAGRPRRGSTRGSQAALELEDTELLGRRTTSPRSTSRAGSSRS